MKMLLIAITALMMSGCAFIQDRPATAKLTIQYATLKYINEDGQRAVRVIERVDDAMALLNDEEATIAAIEAAIRNKIDWRDLSIEDRLLADALMTNIGMTLERRIGDGLLDPDDKIQVSEALGWVRQAAQMVR